MANNKIKFKDVANLYLGCEVIGYYRVEDESTKEPIVVDLKKTLTSCSVNNIISLSGNVGVCDFKPILRPLTDMKAEEINELSQDFRTYKKNDMFLPSEFIYLLKKGFDLFGLIASGQAIDATTLSK